MMSSDPTLPALLSRRGARTVLCAGNGLSIEPIALALLGFRVTVLGSLYWTSQPCPRNCWQGCCGIPIILYVESRGTACAMTVR